MADVNPNDEEKNKSGKIALLVVGVLALGLGIWRISYGISAPFVRIAVDGPTIETEDQKIAKLKTMDTDHDGLSDYDEIYIYHTSPYLKDSDSDGIDDKTEIEKGTDPNCPDEITGKACNTLDAIHNPDATSTPVADIPDLSGQDASSSINLSVPGPVQGTTLTPDEIRQILLQAGANQASLDKISDDDLIKIYVESLKQASQEQNATATTTP